MWGRSTEQARQREREGENKDKGSVSSLCHAWVDPSVTGHSNLVSSVPILPRTTQNRPSERIPSHVQTQPSRSSSLASLLFPLARLTPPLAPHASYLTSAPYTSPLVPLPPSPPPRPHSHPRLPHPPPLPPFSPAPKPPQSPPKTPRRTHCAPHSTRSVGRS